MRRALFVEEVNFKAPAGFTNTVNAAAAMQQTTLSEFVRRAALEKAKTLGIEMPLVEVEPSLVLRPVGGCNLKFKTISARTSIDAAQVDGE